MDSLLVADNDAVATRVEESETGGMFRVYGWG